MRHQRNNKWLNKQSRQLKQPKHTGGAKLAEIPDMSSVTCARELGVLRNDNNGGMNAYKFR